MPADLVANVRFRSREKAQEYIAGVAPIVAHHGGRYLARTASVEVLEGEWHPTAVALGEFPSLEAARRFYDSPEYQPFKRLRGENADSEIVLVEGLTI